MTYTRVGEIQRILDNRRKCCAYGQLSAVEEGWWQGQLERFGAKERKEMHRQDIERIAERLKQDHK